MGRVWKGNQVQALWGKNFKKRADGKLFGKCTNMPQGGQLNQLKSPAGTKGGADRKTAVGGADVLFWEEQLPV